MDVLLANTKGHQQALLGKQGYSASGTLLVSLLKLKSAIERERAKPADDASALLAKGPVAIAKIKAGAETLRRQETASGKCCRCGAALPAERVAELRAQTPDM